MSDLALNFATNLRAVGGTVVELARADLGAWLRGTLDGHRAVSWEEREFAAFSLAGLWSNGMMATRASAGSEARYRELAAAAEFGVTTAALGIAASGSVALLALPTRPRVTSLLPRHHIALLASADLVADLAQAFRRLGGAGLPSQLLFVTGPSRTSDIENDLTIGVHGPAAVTVALVVD